MDKQYITAEQLLTDAIELAFRVIESGFRPDLIAGVWRGGTPVGIAVQEVLELAGINSDHIAIRTSSYTSIGERTSVKVHGLDYLERNLTSEDSLLLVDDVYDTGLSLEQVLRELNSLYHDSPPEVRIATPYYKPGNNCTDRIPDYYLYETDRWLVFPHELVGLEEKELLVDKPLPVHLKEKLIFLQQGSGDRDPD